MIQFHALHDTVNLPHLSTVNIPYGDIPRLRYKSRMETREELVAYLEQRMKELDLNQRSLALSSGCKQDTVRNFMRGVTKNLRSDNYNKIMARVRPDKTDIIGYVEGAMEEITLAKEDSVLESVQRPSGDDIPKNIVAVKVRGAALEPQFEDGWILFYERKSTGVSSDCIEKTCIVKHLDGRMLCKKIRLGSTEGCYHLLSKNPAVQPLFDQKLEWAARIIDVRPA